MNSTIPHPYYPRTAKLPGYVPNTLSMYDCLAWVGVPVALTMGLSLFLLRQRKDLTTREKCTFVWFAVCALIHSVLEGYVGVNHKAVASDQSLLGQLWKEYAHADSRYLTSDPFVINMERITAFCWGSLSIVICYAIYHNKPYRHVAQLVVSVGQLYGDILYFATTLFEGNPHVNPHFFYVWVYFFSFNFVWVVIPSILIVRSWQHLTKAVARCQHTDKKKTK
ncbi:uncharacterized protein VTP21DRAFT_3080 [Calcarisporiella thermophila]|uniref:uncharacterized protein n=1 Tax=Calcarisporiella thermophila TaxID=911321 RepID=UPI0037430540